MTIKWTPEVKINRVLTPAEVDALLATLDYAALYEDGFKLTAKEAAALIREQRQQISDLSECYDMRCREHNRAEAALAQAQQERDEREEQFEHALHAITGYEGEDDALTHLRHLPGTLGGKTVTQVVDERDEAQARIVELTDACNGVIGLVQLIAGRDDLPPGLDDVMLLNHRMTEARRVTDAAMQEQK